MKVSVFWGRVRTRERGVGGFGGRERIKALKESYFPHHSMSPHARHGESHAAVRKSQHASVDGQIQSTVDAEIRTVRRLPLSSSDLSRCRHGCPSREKQLECLYAAIGLIERKAEIVNSLGDVMTLSSTCY